MKLNLLPTTVSRGSGARAGILIAVIMIAVSVFASVTMAGKAQDQLKRAQANVAVMKAPSDQAIQTSSDADKILTTAAGPELNLQLAKAMTEHCSAYPDFYDEVKKYIPAYFRINSLNATPIDANSCTLTMQGVIGSFRQYATLMLVMLRIPGAQAVSRSGYQLTDVVVPGLERDDQVGRATKQGDPRLTDDALQRLDAKIASASETHFIGAGGFGVPGSPIVRGATPNEQAITVAVVVSRHLLTPNPRATLSGGAAIFGAAGK